MSFRNSGAERFGLKIDQEGRTVTADVLGQLQGGEGKGHSRRGHCMSEGAAGGGRMADFVNPVFMIPG